jgi:N-acetylglutamate synthase-like GNAT family acetyltransferase
LAYSFQKINAADHEEIDMIANWYEQQWQIPVSTTRNKLSRLSVANGEFHLLMKLDGRPIATGGISTHVGLLDKMPEFRKYQHWLALVYTLPDQRGKGHGAILCTQLQNDAAALGLKEIFLFTDTAESFYRRLGWQPLERLLLGKRNIVIMNKRLG